MSAYGECAPVSALPDEIIVDGLVDSNGEVEYWGVAQRLLNGKYVCYAVVRGVLCAVEVDIKLLAK